MPTFSANSFGLFEPGSAEDKTRKSMFIFCNYPHHLTINNNTKKTDTISTGQDLFLLSNQKACLKSSGYAAALFVVFLEEKGLLGSLLRLASIERKYKMRPAWHFHTTQHSQLGQFFG